MDLSIVLWIGGMVFSLGIFAVKVGFGLGFGGIKWKGIFLTLLMYLMLFVLIAVMSKRLINLLEPILRKGPYLHALMAIGMIVWGIYLLRRQTTEHRTQIKLKFNIQNSKINNSELSTLNSLLLLIPCPVCLTAMTFSTWSALSVIKLPPVVVGIGLSIVFALLVLTVTGLARLRKVSNPAISLGLSMIGIGLYFVLSIYIPQKIEEARGVYQSFITEKANIDITNSIGVFAILFIAYAIGYFANKKSEV